jgi:hypothetical protein
MVPVARLNLMPVTIPHPTSTADAASVGHTAPRTSPRAHGIDPADTPLTCGNRPRGIKFRDAGKGKWIGSAWLEPSGWIVGLEVQREHGYAAGGEGEADLIGQLGAASAVEGDAGQSRLGEPRPLMWRPSRARALVRRPREVGVRSFEDVSASDAVTY